MPKSQPYDQNQHFFEEALVNILQIQMEYFKYILDKTILFDKDKSESKAFWLP